MREQELEEHGKIVARLRELAKKAEECDEVVGEIRKILEMNPDLAWHLMDVRKTAEQLLINQMIAERDLVGKELLRHQLESMRSELAGDNASPSSVYSPRGWSQRGCRCSFWKPSAQRS